MIGFSMGTRWEDEPKIGFSIGTRREDEPDDRLLYKHQVGGRAGG